MTAENAFVKSDGDILYASEANHQTGDFLLASAGENISAGNVAFIKQSDGKLYVSDTGAADDIRATGICPNAITSGNAGIIQVTGIWITTGLTANTTYYLGATGAISATRSGVQVGHAVSTTKLNINIIQDDRDAVGMIKSYLKSFTNVPANNFTAFWVECNGQVLSDAESPLNGQTIPNLNGSAGTKRFLRGSTTSGTTGGTPDISIDGWGSASTATSGRLATQAIGSGVSTLQVTTNQTHYPEYYEVVFILKVK